MSTIHGKVNDLFESQISIEIVSPIYSKKIEVIVDTGFNGDLVLPEAVISELGLKFLFRNEVELVGKTIKQLNFFKGQIRWFNDEIIIVDVVADDSFLIGTNLLKRGKLWIDYQSNEVLIKE